LWRASSPKRMRGSPVPGYEDTLPAHTGTAAALGLDGPVDVFRDAHGIPHARARSARDAFFAQGWVHAQDRLWQMELDRRRATGRLAELLGPDALARDVFLRRLQLEASCRTDVQALDGPAREMLDAYALGVNAFLGATPTLPLELQLLGVRPEPWEPWQSAAVFKIHHALWEIWNWKLWRARLLGLLGPEGVSRFGTYPWTDGVLVTPPGAPDTLGPPVLEPLFAEAALVAQACERGGSNTFALHGRRTASGKPLVGGDPHRVLTVPSTHVQGHLACPAFDVIGFSMAGVPGFTHFAHNAHVAWCVSHAMADNQDLYLERFHPEDPTRYEFRGEWRAAERATATIAVRGEPARTIALTRTQHGPIVLGDPGAGTALAMRFTATDRPDPTFHGVRRMLEARSVVELDEAMRPWVSPCNNLTMADVHGDVAYLHRGRVPVRSAMNGWFPVPGWTGEHEWTSDVPFEELPRARGDLLVTANHRVAGAGYPHYLALNYEPPFRAQRILERLGALERATIDDLAATSLDRVSIPSRAFVAAVARVEPASELARDARRHLLAWNGSVDADGAAPAIYVVLRDELVRLVAERAGLEPLARPVPGDPGVQSLYGYLWMPVLSMSLHPEGSVFADEAGFTAFVGEALERACQRLRASLGENPAAWRWGDLHRARPRHPLAALFPAHGLLDPPSVAVGGDAETPMMSEHHFGEDLEVGYTAVARYVFDLADWDRSRWVVALGASGHPASPHYADQAPLWAAGQLCDMVYSWSRIEAEAESTQRLVPGSI
jgi:penicillin G amidase